MVQIDTDIPLPRPAGRRGRIARYPWADMKVGHSFHVVGVTRNAIRTTATYHEQRRGWLFQVEPEGDGFRVFRMS